MKFYFFSILVFVLAACVAGTPADRGIGAASAGTPGLVASYLREGLDPNTQNADGVTMLMAAASVGNTEIVELLLENGAVADIRNNQQMTALFYAAKNGHTDVAKALLAAGAKVDPTLDNGVTPLLLACSNDHAEFMLLLIESGAGVNASNDWGYTPLNCASFHGMSSVVEALLARGADVEHREKLNNETALFSAAGAGHREIVEQLIAANAQLDVVNNHRCTPYLLARYYGHEGVAEALVSAGADPLHGSEKCQQLARERLTPRQSAEKLRQDRARAERNIAFNDGYVHLQDGNYAKAIQRFSEFIAENPQSDAAYYNRGVAYARIGKYLRAQDDFGKTIELSPAFAPAYKDRCLVALRQQNYQQALADCNRAIELNLADHVVYHNRAIAHYHLGNYSATVADLSKSLEIQPGIAQSHAWRCYAFADLKQNDSAFEDCNRAIELDPDITGPHYTRGKIYQARLEYGKAIADLKFVLEKNPRHLYALNSLAWIQATARDRKFRDGEQAVMYALEAVELSGRNNAMMLDTLAAAYAENGQFDKAAQTQLEAMEYLDLPRDKELERLFEKILDSYRQGNSYY